MLFLSSPTPSPRCDTLPQETQEAHLAVVEQCGKLLVLHHIECLQDLEVEVPHHLTLVAVLERLKAADREGRLACIDVTQGRERGVKCVKPHRCEIPP